MPLPPRIAAAIQAGDTVITSSARAARALRRLYAEAQREQGLEAWQSPDVLDWDTWLHHLWQKRLRSGNETRLLLTHLQEQQIWMQVIKPHIEGRRLISVPGVADLAQQAYGLLTAYRALDFLRKGRLGGGPDVENFCEWALQFERECHKQGWLSRGMLPLLLHGEVPEGHATARLWLTGFDRLTPAQQFLIESLRDRGRQVETITVEPVASADPPLLVKALDKRDEVSTCALWVRSQLAAAAAEGRTPRIAVVVPGVTSMRPEIEGTFRRIIAPAMVTIRQQESPLPFEFSLGVPLAGMPMIRAALLVLRWLHRPIAQEQMSWLMLSGFVSEREEELLLIAAFEAKLRRLPMRQPELDLDTLLEFLGESWREAMALGPLRRRLQAGQRIVPPNALLSFSEWVALAANALQAVGWPGVHPLQSEDFQVAARWAQLLDTVAELAFDGSKVAYAEFVDVLERQAGQMIFAPESRDAPVQILGPLEAAGLTFDMVWFLGADDANWPAVARPHPFLTRLVQREHGMPHADSAIDWELAQQVTIRLQKSAGSCVFSYPAQNAEGLCRPSTLVSSLPHKINAAALRVALGDEDLLFSERHFPILQADLEESAVVPWPRDQDAGGSEVLKRQAACPFQSFATSRLKARPLDETDWGLEPRDRGSVVHEILAGLWEELASLDGLVAAHREPGLEAVIQRHVQAALERYGKRVHARTRRWTRAYLDAEAERITTLMEEWLRYELKRAPFTIEAGEKELDATVGDLKLRLRADRIDAVPGGRLVIDYKTGVVKTEAWEGERPDEPQLLLYATQLEDVKGVLFGRVRQGEIKFLGCVENANAVMPGESKLSRPPLTAGMLHAWREVLLALGQQFLRGEAQVDPKRYPKTCVYCELPGLCRIAESERANAGAADESDGKPID